MAAAGLAARMADELGTTYDDAARWVDELGGSRASRVADEAAQAGDEGVGDWWKPVAATGGLVGAGGLAWRQQDVWTAEAVGNAQQDYSSAVQSIMEDDSLSPEQKQEFIDQLTENLPDGENDDGDSGFNPLKDIQDALGLGSVQTTLVLVIVVAIVLSQVLDGGDN